MNLFYFILPVGGGGVEFYFESSPEVASQEGSLACFQNEIVIVARDFTTGP